MSASNEKERPARPGTPVEQQEFSKMLEDLSPEKLRQLAEEIEERDERDRQRVRRVRADHPSWQEQEEPEGALAESMGPGIDLAEIIEVLRVGTEDILAR